MAVVGMELEGTVTAPTTVRPALAVTRPPAVKAPPALIAPEVPTVVP